MRFSIDSLILWPKNAEFGRRDLPFNSNQLNIITGASRTGKSSIIPIIDYCLGSGKCTIPVKTIRDACGWFGVVFSMDDEYLLLARKEPGAQQSTGEMFMYRGNEKAIPEIIDGGNTTVDAVRNLLNELFSISFLETDPTNDNFTHRPSYRDLMAFIFQPQNIIANADVLFYKADTHEHRQKLINIFPYILGAVTPQILSARQELERLQKEKDRLMRDLHNIQNVAETWRQDVHSWISQARELGLTNYIWNEKDTFEEHLHQLRLIINKTEVESQLTSERVMELSDEIVALRKEEQEVATSLFAAQQRYSEMAQLRDSVGQYDQSLKIQLERLNISKWLRSLVESNNSTCLLCGTKHGQSNEEINQLCDAIEVIETTASGMQEMPAAFEREMQAVNEEIQLLTEKVKALRTRIQVESGKQKETSEKKYTLTSVARFLGNLESSVKTYESIGTDSELSRRIEELSDKISELRSIVNEAEIQKKVQTALRYVEAEAARILPSLDVERPNDPIEFIIKDLTIRVKNPMNGRTDYLWEIGSASNWLSYHIAVILAFHKFFLESTNIVVPNFVIFDQPSQVYFPQLPPSKVADENEPVMEDEDKLAAKKIFSTLSEYIGKRNKHLQILIMEHADEGVWGEFDNIHLVERWRGTGQKLVPDEWLQ